MKNNHHKMAEFILKAPVSPSLYPVCTVSGQHGNGEIYLSGKVVASVPKSLHGGKLPVLAE